MLLMSGADSERADSWGMTALHWAAFSGHLSCTELLLTSGASVHVRDADGQTPLHWASRGHPQVSYALLAFGADAHAMDTDGKKPADWARSEGDSRLEAVLRAGESEELGAQRTWIVDVRPTWDAVD